MQSDQYSRGMMIKRLFMCLLLALMVSGAQAQDGEAVFKANCTSCHKMDKKMTGPALMGAIDRWEGQLDEMAAFIRNSQAYMKAGKAKSAYAQNLFKEYNNTVMTPQPLKDEEIKAVLAYIQNYKPPAGDNKPVGPVEPQPVSPTTYFSLAVLVGGLMLVCLLLVLMIAVIIHALKAKEDGAKVNWETFSNALSSFLKNKFVATAIGLGVLFILSNSLIDFAATINFNQNYQPVQPIAFSHKLHAGQYQIDCKYCHIGVEKGKNATIPSTNICMNCHNAVEEGPKYGKKEIAKILDAYQNNKPIEWVKIHALPDLVYFNHSQHVKVAGLECKECHGEVEKMEEVYQFAKLSMGWCVDCHRKKEVDINKSDYYRSIHASLREQQKKGGTDKITVEKLGGLECARCHY